VIGEHSAAHGHPRCLSCGAQPLDPVLSLGHTPLANSLLTAASLDRNELTFPLDLAFCPTCALVQITEVVPPDTLFRDYLYFSSFSDTMLRHAETLTRQVRRNRQLGDQSLVMEVASNDGYLLQFYKRAGIPVLGIEPARNIAKVAVDERGIPTIAEFFDEGLAGALAAEGRRVDVLHANNVLAHVSDLNGFVRGIRLVLKDDGVAVIETPYVGDMIERLEFDTIYHEHLFYYSLTALDRLFDRHDLRIVDVERLTIHGGSLRVFAQARRDRPAGLAVTRLLSDEAAAGMNRLAYYADFGRRVERLKVELVGLLTRLRKDGRRLAAYGASAKGSTLLNYFGIGRSLLDFVVDRSTHKQGRYMPGVRLPIYPTSRLLETLPDYTLLLTWNFLEEILEQQAEYRRRGGQFIVPLPEVTVMGAALERA
jgi:SAM-dependent methyltransferase